MARPIQLCPDANLSALVAALGADETRAMREIDGELAAYPGDPRLHFLKGSMLASRQDYAAAREAMRQAVDLAPDYKLARFQLGLLILTSGEAYAAQETWGPLHALPDGDYIKLFVDGLCHLIRDDFPETIRLLEQGMAHNTEIAPMNRDMQLIIDEVRAKMRGDGGSAASSVDLLLQQAALKASRH